jgi:hypothetical protein
MLQMTFTPAANKLEAVNRISDLTDGGPQSLGPGSKERKSVLVNLAIGLGIPFTHELTKHLLAAHLASNLGVSWRPEHQSSGQTITLKGLNLLLQSASNFSSKNASHSLISVRTAFETELNEIAKVVREHTPLIMNGKNCVEEMLEIGHSQWRQTEWQGFYFEMVIAKALISELGGSPLKQFNTSFDYSNRFIWDLKVHSSEDSNGRRKRSCILNDSRAVEKAVDETGLGFIVLTGTPTYDVEFTKWHKKFRKGNDKDSIRTLKSQFVSERLDIFFVPDTTRLESALAKKELTVQAQGKNSNNKSRPPKYHLNLAKALGGELHVYSHIFI